MGVQTPLTQEVAQALFPAFTIESLLPTTDGVMDTTYLSDNYVVKYFERDMGQKLALEREVLNSLALAGCNTSKYFSSTVRTKQYRKPCNYRRNTQK